MAGALIVEGRADDNIHDLEDLPEIAAARDQVFVLQQFWYRVDPTDNVGRVDARDLYAHEPKAYPFGCGKAPDVDPKYLVKCTAVNGVVVPTYELAPGEVQRWRFVHAGREDTINLAWVDEDGKPVPALQFNEIAVDGIATGALTVKNVLSLNPGNRSDVLIKAPKQSGVYYLQDQASTAARSLRRVAKPERIVMKVSVRGIPRRMTFPSAERLVLCKPYSSVSDQELLNPGKPRTVELDSNDDDHTFNIDGKPFSMQEPLSVQLNTAEEWVVKAKRNAHLFHIHVNPFEVILERKDGRTTKSEWRDTLLLEPGEAVTIRSRFRDFSGMSVMHCHILDHEDQGMMRRFEILAPGQAKKKLGHAEEPR